MNSENCGTFLWNYWNKISLKLLKYSIKSQHYEFCMRWVTWSIWNCWNVLTKVKVYEFPCDEFKEIYVMYRELFKCFNKSTGLRILHVLNSENCGIFLWNYWNISIILLKYSIKSQQNVLTKARVYEFCMWWIKRNICDVSEIKCFSKNVRLWTLYVVIWKS